MKKNSIFILFFLFWKIKNSELQDPNTECFSIKEREEFLRDDFRLTKNESGNKETFRKTNRNPDQVEKELFIFLERIKSRLVYGKPARNSSKNMNFEVGPRDLSKLEDQNSDTARKLINNEENDSEIYVNKYINELNNIFFGLINENMSLNKSYKHIENYLEEVRLENNALKLKKWESNRLLINLQTENDQLNIKCTNSEKLINILRGRSHKNMPEKMLQDILNSDEYAMVKNKSNEITSFLQDESSIKRFNITKVNDNYNHVARVPVFIHINSCDKEKEYTMPIFYISEDSKGCYFLSFINSFFSIEKIRTHFLTKNFNKRQFLLSQFKKFAEENFIPSKNLDSRIDISRFHRKVIQHGVLLKKFGFEKQNCVLELYEEIMIIFRREEKLEINHDETNESDIEYSFGNSSLSKKLKLGTFLESQRAGAQKNTIQSLNLLKPQTLKISNQDSSRNLKNFRDINLNDDPENKHIFRNNGFFYNSELNAQPVLSLIMLTFNENKLISEVIRDNYENGVFKTGLGILSSKKTDFLFFNLNLNFEQKSEENKPKNKFFLEKRVTVGGFLYKLSSFVVWIEISGKEMAHYYTVVVKNDVYITFDRIIKTGEDSIDLENIKLLVYEKI